MDHKAESGTPADFMALTPDQGIDVDALLFRADMLRDTGRWEAAGRAYAAFLEHRPTAWGIRVQLGHCRKEAGDPAGALEQYRAAEAMAPEDADLKLQIGHSLKLLGDLDGALAHYEAAQALDPEFMPAAQEATRLREMIALLPARVETPAAGAEAAAALQLVFDVADVLDYFRGKRTPTGIQRVQLGIVTQAVSEAPPEGMDVQLAAFMQKQGLWRAVPAELFLTLSRLSQSGSDSADPAWVAALAMAEELLAEAPPFAFAPGACLVNLGNSFGFADYFRALRELQRQLGLRYIPFVHDCVPLIVPEHCTLTMVRDYARWFGGVAAHADALLVNSENTRRDVAAQVERLLPGLDLPVEVVRLDADFRAGTPPPDPSALAEVAALRPGEPFVLFVSTIESRKNHQLVFGAWLQLVRRFGRAAVPRLVCVGKEGWHAEGALNLYRNAPELRQKVLMLDRVSDRALSALYASCRFTVYNSHYEGWGLPVTESLAYGKVPLVPAHSSMPEAGGPGAVYFTPQNEPDLVAKLERLIFDDAWLAGREAAVAAGPKLRGWGALRDQVLDGVRRFAALPPPAGARVAVALGTLYRTRLAAETRPSAGQMVAEVTREGPGWDLPQDWGVASRGGLATLRFPLGGRAAEAPLRLFLELRGPVQPALLLLRAMTDDGTLLATPQVALAAEEECTVMLDIPPLAASAALVLDMELEPLPEDTVEGQTLPEGPVVIGLRGFMLCRQDDLAARLAFLEAQRFQAA
jgi:glycosyltransferase involved in cell wall biosynthesis